MSSPISDLSYRGYQGGLAPDKSRWQVIFRQALRMALKKRAYWILMVLSGAHYLIFIAVSYFIDSFAGNMGGEQLREQFFSRIIWRDQFLQGFQLGHFLLMSISLLVGAGAIANDNRSRALLVYLSKPCSKRDYLIGKWMGMFVPIAMALAIPATIFYFYGAMNYREFGFLSDDPWLYPKVLGAITLASAFQSSVILGISSLFDQGRLAGAAYAGTYVLTGIFAGIAQTIAANQKLPDSVLPWVDRLHYLSLYGGIEGLYKTVLQTDGSFSFRDRGQDMLVPRPELWLLAIVVILPMFGMLWAAWRKVRAVEVVG